jgi:KDO2-lipid IV(A) lauroyltransferase
MARARILPGFLRPARLVEDVAVALMVAAIKITAALPGRWILRVGDVLGALVALVDRRGHRVGMQNLRVAFGDALPRRACVRILRASCQQAVRAVLILLHVQPLTPRRFRRWVHFPDVEDEPEARLMRARGGVLVSGHVGNWELLIGMRILFQHFPPSVFMAEEIPHRAIERVVRRLRSHGDILSALRKGGARTLIRVVADGGTAGILVDRNVRGAQGGVYAPFFGLPARTTPLPAWLALRYDVPVYPILCLPHGDDRYRLWLGPNLAENLTGADEQERTVEILTRMNGVLEDVIRAQPELWNWRLKRFKSRPTQELGAHPPYSLWDP